MCTMIMEKIKVSSFFPTQHQMLNMLSLYIIWILQNNPDSGGEVLMRDCKTGSSVNFSIQCIGPEEASQHLLVRLPENSVNMVPRR